MKQLTYYITYCADVDILLDEVEANYPQYIQTLDGGERKIIGFPKIDAIHNPSNTAETICICRNLPDESYSLLSLTILGQFSGSGLAGAPDENTAAWFANKFVSPEAKALYENVVGRPATYIDDNNVEHELPYITCIA